MTNREELIRFVLEAYWGDMLVEVKPCMEDVPSLFYLVDCGKYTGFGAIEGTWEDVWSNDCFSEAVRDACGCSDSFSVFGNVPTAVVRSIVAILDRKEEI